MSDQLKIIEQLYSSECKLPKEIILRDDPKSLSDCQMRSLIGLDYDIFQLNLSITAMLSTLSSTEDYLQELATYHAQTAWHCGKKLLGITDDDTSE